MSRRVDELPSCNACGGRLFPFVICDGCGTATILRDAKKLEWPVPCPTCGTLNPWQLVCQRCRSRQPAPAVARGASKAGKPTRPTVERAPITAGRPKRRVKGDVDARALADMLRILGLDSSRSRALIERGYDALWKIARATERELARIPEVGPVAARKVVASFHLLNYSPPQRTKESIAREEYECPLCRCVTSAIAGRCLECGAAFDEEEMDEAIRNDLVSETDANALTFFDGRLRERPSDSEILYSRGLLLESLGRIDEAVEAFERATLNDPDARKIKVALLRLQARYQRTPDAAAKLRSTATALLDDVEWDQEVARLDRLISESRPACPNCRTPVPKGASQCPACGARLAAAEVTRSPAAAESVRSPELDALVGDLLVGELEASLSQDELERTKAAVLDWLIAELEDSMGPDERVVAPAEKGSEETPQKEPSPLSKSVGFLSGWMRGSRGLVSGLRPKGAPRAGGKVNGLVNGVGRTNGLVNGVGRVNGLTTPAGRVNGLVGAQGRINGIVNGTQFARPQMKGLRLPSPSRRVRYASIAGGILIAILIVAVLIAPSPVPSNLISIDGAFGDWASVPHFDAATVASDADVSISRYAALVDRDSLFLFASMRGAALGDSVDLDGVFFLIDGDGDASTGFSFDGIGADGVVEVFGGNHQVEGARLYSFPVGSEVNWSQRQGSGAAQAAASAQGLEARVSTYEIDRFSPTLYRIAVYADDFQGISSRSRAFLTPTGASILAEVRPLVSIIGTTPTNLFEIRIRALGLSATTDVPVSNFTFTATSGVAVSFSPESVTLTQGQPEAVVTASVSASGFFPGDLVEVHLTGAVAPHTVVLRGGPARAYVVAPSSLVRIDGLFADWNGKDNVDTDPARVNNSNVDIVQYGAAVNTSHAFFHVAVGGEVFEGRVPQRFVRSPPGQGGNGTTRPIPLPRQTGEDILRVYIDLNATQPDGFPVGGILADYLFEIRGEGSRIRARSLSTWNASWVSVALPHVALAKNDTDIEGSLALGPTTDRTRMVVAMTDWSGISDITPPANATVQAPAPAPERSGQTLNAPEFHEIAIPLAGTLFIGLWFGRRRRRSS